MGCIPAIFSVRCAKAERTTHAWFPGSAPTTLSPPPGRALGAASGAPGLLAASADLLPARLVDAYRRGIFPWYSDGQPVLWWSPDPRMVLRPADFKVSPSLRKTLRKVLRATTHGKSASTVISPP